MQLGKRLLLFTSQSVPFISSVLVYEAEKCSVANVSGPSHSHHEHIWYGSGMMEDPGCLCSIWSPQKALRHLMEAANLLCPTVSPTHELDFVHFGMMAHFLPEHSSHNNSLYIYLYVCMPSRLSRWLVFGAFCITFNFSRSLQIFSIFFIFIFFYITGLYSVTSRKVMLLCF